jgi:signal transduction histidine kinase
MKLVPQRTWLSLAVVAVLASVLIVLAVLQYLWIGQVSNAERERMQAGLNTAVGQFRRELNYELQQVAAAFQLDPAALDERDWGALARRYESWTATAGNARIISGLYVWEPAADNSSRLLRLNTALRRFETVAWPPRLQGLQVRASLQSQGVPRLSSEFRPFAWALIEEIPLLISAVLRMPGSGPAAAGNAQFMGFILVELNSEYLRQQLFPDLVERFFGSALGFMYHIAIMGPRGESELLYQSTPTLPPNFFSAPDSKTSLFGEPPFGMPRIGGDRQGDGRRMSPDDGTRLRSFPSRSNQPPGRGGRGRGGIMLLPDRPGESWMLLVKHHEGSLEQAVAGQRRRNLGVSFGILLLLAISMAMIVLSTRRAQRLVNLQMKFVAGVSHELRTPLAVICSAGENLADGVVAESGDQIRQYGELVREEGRRLSGMVEQILQFAGNQAGRRTYHLRPASAADVVQSALAKTHPMLEAAGFKVETTIEPGLPQIQVDAALLTQSLENLINNAFKYSGTSRWIGLQARGARTRGRPEVQITIEDRGIGIDAASLRHIFDPFYRGPGAVEAQIHGSGLGLSLAREAIAAMGGRISVKSTPGAGSSFTIHIPAAKPDEAMESGMEKPS